ncbi:MAG: hypothetical protein MJA31_14670 [Clostridia bacterium]|nr:hypothetical protein [Clostridia bacterium]
MKSKRLEADNRKKGMQKQVEAVLDKIVDEEKVNMTEHEKQKIISQTVKKLECE